MFIWPFQTISANINDGTILSELMGVFTKDDCYSDNFPVTSKMKYDFKYVKEGNKMIRNEGVMTYLKRILIRKYQKNLKASG